MPIGTRKTANTGAFPSQIRRKDPRNGRITGEIEAFVGDRLLEALWLIKDDICDVETLDDVIRHSFGLRWAQMGPGCVKTLVGLES
jgi:3-hydroxyacyl-CoA dehydrogenase